MWSDRSSDMNKEKYLSALTGEMYRQHGYDIQRCEDYQDQINGVDWMLSKDGQQWLVDEKAAITRLDGNLKTFCFELYCEKNYNSYGWLINPSSITTHYSLVYPHSVLGEIDNLDDIQIIIIEKEKVKSFVLGLLHSHNIHFNTIKWIMSQQSAYHGRHSLWLCRDCKIVYSEYIYPEQPINAIVSKDWLIRNSSDYFAKTFY